MSRADTLLYPGHKRPAIDVFTDKENVYYRKEVSNTKNIGYGDERHGRALRFLDQNHGLNRYDTRLRGVRGGIR